MKSFWVPIKKGMWCRRVIPCIPVSFQRPNFSRWKKLHKHGFICFIFSSVGRLISPLSLQGPCLPLPPREGSSETWPSSSNLGLVIATWLLCFLSRSCMMHTAWCLNRCTLPPKTTELIFKYQSKSLCKLLLIFNWQWFKLWADIPPFGTAVLLLTSWVIWLPLLLSK